MEPFKFAPKLILWTDKGAARHAKILDTDEAWEVYEELEDTYFKVKENKQLLSIDLQTQNQMLQLAQGMQMIGSVVQSVQNTVTNIQEYVKDSINSKDYQIDKTATMIGLRDRNTKMLTNELKEKLNELTGKRITAKHPIYKEFKKNIFKKYQVFKWEDIPIGEYNSVHKDIIEITIDKIERIG